MVWNDLFVKHQGFTHETKILYQDNMSDIRLEINVKASSGKHKICLNILYLFIKDQVDQFWVKTEYCPTREIRVDHYKKLLQGIQFRLTFALILNYSIELTM